MDSNKRVLLNELTGISRNFEGIGLGQPMSFGCIGFEEASDVNQLKVIQRKHVERGI